MKIKKKQRQPHARLQVPAHKVCGGVKHVCARSTLAKSKAVVEK